MAILSARTEGDPLDDVVAVAGASDVLRMRSAAAAIRVSEELKHYVVALIHATRQHHDVRVGASPRASLALLRTSQALALFDGQSFLTPDHVQEIVFEVVGHRVVLQPESRYSGVTEDQVVNSELAEVRAPS